MSAVILITALVVASVLAFTPRIRGSRSWKATVTPLSSIMGSGFLVSAPLVASVAGVWAPLAMGALLVVAFFIGAMVRFNIRHAEHVEYDAKSADEHRLHVGHRFLSRTPWTRAGLSAGSLLERGSHFVLAAAYVISVSYYLQLLSAFVLDQFGIHDELWNRVGTTSVLVLIALIGGRWGLRALEKVETYAVSLNLGMIAALLVGLIIHASMAAAGGTLALPDLTTPDDLGHSTRVMMGLLIVVQGFETSRFLGSEHSADERARTMRSAQLISAGIYVSFIALMLPLLSGQAEAEVTAIVGLVTPVAAVLPILIVVAAIGSQFSAAVADDAGCAGLVGTIFHDRLSPRWIYVGIGALTVGLTWLTDVLSIISIASRAFALFYALQCAVTAATALSNDDIDRRWLYIFSGAALCLVSLAVTIFGVPAE